MKTIRSLIRDERGAASTEYAVLLALIAVGVASAVTLLRDEIEDIFQAAASGFGNAK